MAVEKVTAAELTEALRVLIAGREAWSKHVLNSGACWCGQLIANSAGPEAFLALHLPCADAKSEREAWPDLQRQSVSEGKK